MIIQYNECDPQMRCTHETFTSPHTHLSSINVKLIPKNFVKLINPEKSYTREILQNIYISFEHDEKQLYGGIYLIICINLCYLCYEKY